MSHGENSLVFKLLFRLTKTYKMFQFSTFERLKKKTKNRSSLLKFPLFLYNIYNEKRNQEGFSPLSSGSKEVVSFRDMHQIFSSFLKHKNLPLWKEVSDLTWKWESLERVLLKGKWLRNRRESRIDVSQTFGAKHFKTF